MIKTLVAMAMLFTGELNAQQVYNKLSVKELDVTSRVNVASTTQSSKPCPAMTETQRNAISSPLNGSCIYNTTTSKLNVYNGSVWKAAGGGVDNWATATVYAVDDIVIQSSKIYQCLVAHTSGTFATDLAALKWTEISATVAVNLTGPITSVGNATSIASQTGTGTKFVVDNTPTLITPNIGAATGTSLTLAGNISAYNYDKDNLLVNGNIENPLSSEWTCTVGTCTRTTTGGEFSKDTAALKVALSAQAMNVSQSVTTPSGIQKQGFVRVIYRIPATMADAQICSLVDGSEQTCIPTNSLIKDDTFRTAEIPLTFGTTSAGIKFKTTSTYTANAYFDGAIVAQGLGTQNLMLDNIYSAKMSNTGVVSALNVPSWVSCSGSAGTYTCTFATGLFTVAPNCTGSGFNDAGVMTDFNATSTGMTIRGYNDTSALASRAMIFHCQKSGNDYLAASSNVYASQNANYSRTQYTPTFTGFGTVSVHSCYHSRDGGDLLLDCRFTTGTPTATEARVSLPNSLVPDTSVTSIRNYGWWFNGNPLVAPGGVGIVSANSYVTFGSGAGGNNGLSALNGNGMSSGAQDTHFFARIPISGWSNSNVIVGSFAGIETCNAATSECVDTFSAKISSGGVVSDENSDFINGNCTWSPAGIATCPFVASKFTVTPNCFPVNASADTASTVISSTSTSQVVIRSAQANTGTLNSWTTNILCQKTGVDYKPKTAKVASSIGVPTVPGITTEAIDTFSVSYGTTNATTNCSVSPCSYLDQIGTMVTSVTRASTGLYTMVLGRTYTKLKCAIGGLLTAGTDAARFTTPLQCASCSSLTFTTANQASVVADTAGTIQCMGSY